MIGSRREDISFAEMLIKVEEAKVYIRGQGTITKGTKTEHRYRKTPSQRLVDRYRAIWKKQQMHRKDLPDEYQDNNLILAKIDGNCYSPRKLQLKYRNVVKRAA